MDFSTGGGGAEGEAFAREEALQNDLIVETLLSFLPLDTLKVIRQVSSYFNVAAMKEMYRKYYFNLSLRRSDSRRRYGHDKEDEDLREFLSMGAADPVKFRNLKTTIDYELGHVLLPHLDIYGHNVRKLVYAMDHHAQIWELCDKLTQLPNLKVLHLPFLSAQPTYPRWNSFCRLLEQLDNLTIASINQRSKDALQYFIKLKKEAPVCIQKCFPGIANWSSEVGGGRVPGGSLIGGRDNEIEHNLIVARSYHPQGDLLPGKLVAAHGICYVPWNCQGHDLTRYETLILKEDEVEWVGATNDEVVPGAIVGGMTEYGELLYIGRAIHEGSVHLGKVHRSHRVLYIAYNGLEVAHASYETLVLKSAVSN